MHKIDIECLVMSIFQTKIINQALFNLNDKGKESYLNVTRSHGKMGSNEGVLIIKEVKCQGYKVEIQMRSAPSHSYSLVYSGDEWKSFEGLHFYLFEYSHFVRNIYISQNS